MVNLKYKTRGNSSLQGKPRVYFFCHPEDFNKYFETVSDEILAKQNCAIWYTDEEIVRDEDFLADLKQMQLFVMPVTTNLLCTENEALNTEFKFAIENHIPVLPLMQESGLEELFNKKCGDLQFLDKNNTDVTAIGYDEKLRKYLESVLIGDELAEKIRAAFDAYVFLSYRKKDRRYAQELMRLIHKNEFCRDIAIWYDEFLTPGENFNDSIKEALQKSGLFVLTVTPNLVNEPNYIMTTEYPMAKQKGKPILPAELVPTDREQLSEKYEGIPNPADAHNEAELSEALLESIKKMAIKENDNSLEHNFFIGLAYLGGVDVEVDRERALELIVGAANNELPEAMIKLISMYTDGVGVSRDQSQAKKWSKKLAGYYFKNVFSQKGSIKSKKKIVELFSNYKDKYWSETIKCFLLNADKSLSNDTIKTLYEIVMSLGICEYTLLFDACKDLTQYQEETQIILVRDILIKSVNGTYPPYGPFFWYIPEYELYEVALLTLDALKNSSDFAKMLALVRDVCWIFGHKNTSEEITNRVFGSELYNAAKNDLLGIRNALCELFFTGKTDYNDGEDVYPRCFNVAEAKSFKNTGCGIYGVMHMPFDDELSLFFHEAFNDIEDEFIGLVSCSYNIPEIEILFMQKPHNKVSGLILGPTNNTKMEFISFNRSHIRILYVPENLIEINNNWSSSYISLETSIGRSNKEKMYIWEEIIVPEDIEKIPASMFGGCSSATSVHLHDRIKEIGWSAFSGCVNLASIQIPSGVKKIGGFVFKNCTSLKSIIMSDGVVSIDHKAFENCQGLEYIKIPDSVSFIGERAFTNCTNLSSIHLPYGITFINDGLFENCINLRSVNIPLTVKKISQSAFAWCKQLNQINLHENIEAIGSHAFARCESLKSVCVPEKVTTIYAGTFSHCKGLVNITFNKNLTLIGSCAFFNCKSLVHIDMPENIADIDGFVFAECTSLETINIPRGVKEIHQGAFLNCINLTNVIFNENVLSIEKEAFKGCSKLVKISLPKTEHVAHDAFEEYTQVIYANHTQSDADGMEANTVINIDADANEIPAKRYKNRDDIKSVFVPGNVKKIGLDAFKNCTGLSSVYLSDGVKKIDWGVFDGCISISSVIIPNSVKAIGKLAFRKCIALTGIVLSESLQTIEAFTFEDCKSLKTITIPDGVVDICGGAFRNCESLETVDMSDNVVFIAYGAFEGCESLTTIRIPQLVKTIKYGTFKGCTNLANVFISDNVQEIEQYAFEGCKQLLCINMPDNITIIGNYAFKGCGMLSVVLPRKITLIQEGIFDSCINLNSIFIPDGVTKICEKAFRGCSNLTMINLPDGILEIGKEAFKGCARLEKLEIPVSARLIEDGAFAGCGSLTTVIISRRFEGDIQRIFGDIDSSIITFI